MRNAVPLRSLFQVLQFDKTFLIPQAVIEILHTQGYPNLYHPTSQMRNAVPLLSLFQVLQFDKTFLIPHAVIGIVFF